MIIKIRLNQRIYRNISLTQRKYFSAASRVTHGYVIGLAAQQIDQISNQTWEEAIRISAEKEENGKSTSLTLRQDTFDSLQTLQQRLQAMSGPMPLARVIDVLMIAENLAVNNTGEQKEICNEARETLQQMSQVSQVRLDHFDFKQIYQRSADPDKERLYKYIRHYLEENPHGKELRHKMDERIAADLRSYSDYYNLQKYYPTRRQTLGRANIVYISKVLAGLLLMMSEIEGGTAADLITEP